MIIAGLKLTLLGMSVVVLFLILLMLFIHISHRLLSTRINRELSRMEAAEQRVKRTSSIPAMGDKVLVAIITAAVAVHRARVCPAGDGGAPH
jgi:sodium pump decarboxylase gamma subunit